MASYIDAGQNRYKTTNQDFKGLFVVINNDTFGDPNLSFRNGSQKDVSDLQTTFRPLGFHFDVHHNRTRTEMLRLMGKVANSKLDGYDCLAVAILTHGLDDGKVYGTGPPGDIISLDNLLIPLKKLTNEKPKLVFVQACRGEDLDEGRLVATDNDTSDSEIQNYIKVPMEADFLYHFSSSPGYVSFRSDNGSVFIQALCAVTQLHIVANPEINFLTVLTRVNRRVADDCSSNDPNRPPLQMPSIVSMLRKDLYLLRRAL